ncbi:MAG: hypothetical protein RI967_425 [Planctomycetota bacterium]|jgi:hypothetical protein
MPGLSAHGKTLVGNFRRTFEEEYGVPVRVYHGVKFAKEDATLASIRVDGHPGGREIELHGNMKVGTAEAKVLEAIGIRIQIEDGRGGLASDDVTLASLRSGPPVARPSGTSNQTVPAAPQPALSPSTVLSQAPKPALEESSSGKKGCLVMLLVGGLGVISTPLALVSWLA